ncbi:hypothetical protein [Flavobacterium sp.]
MKSKILKIIFTFLIFGISISCSKDDDSSNQPENSMMTVYKNQTGNLEGNALQAKYKKTDYTFNFYGLFDSNNEPLASKSVTYQKANNDTIVNLILNPVTNKIAAAYTSVNNVKLPVVIKFDYIENSTTEFNISFHQYNWSNNTSELIYSTRVSNNNGIVTENPFQASKITLAGNSFGDYLLGGIVGVGFAEVVSAFGAPTAFSAIGTLSTAAASFVVAVGPITVLVGAAIIAYALIPSSVFAADVVPTNEIYPLNTPIVNPSVNVTPNLNTSSCSETNINFSAGMDSFGNILVSGVSGGQSPYSYLVNSGFQASQVFPNNYADGSYFVSVKDANGCLSTKMIPLTDVPPVL